MIYITSRAEVAVDYVLHPGENGSIELTAPVGLEDSSLTFQHSKIFGFTADKLLSKDRITIIDCKGTCGVSFRRALALAITTSCGSCAYQADSKITNHNCHNYDMYAGLQKPTNRTFSSNPTNL